MADIKQAFGTSTAITITLTSLASGSARESTVVDNATNLYLDAILFVTCKLATGTPTGQKRINIYVYGSEDGTNFTDNASGSDAAITLRVPTNLKYLTSIQCPDAGGLAYKSHPMSIRQAFGGILPREWGIVVENQTGVALDSSGNAAAYTGVYLTAS